MAEEDRLLATCIVMEQELKEQQAEIERLTRDLDTAQIQAEHHRVMSMARQDEVERLQRDREEIEATVADALRHVGWHDLEQRFRTSQSPLHQRLSMAIHVLSAKAGGDDATK